MSVNEHMENFKNILKHILMSDRLLRLIFINMTLWGLSTYFAVWIFQKYWKDNSVELVYFGVLWAVYNLVGGFASKWAPNLEKRLKAEPLLFIMGILPILGYFGMSMTAGWVGILIGLCFQVSRGLNQVIMKDAFNWRVPSQFRATANSLSSFSFRLIFGVFGPVVGWVMDTQGMERTLQYLGFSFVFVFIFLLLPLITLVRRQDQKSS